MATQNWDWIFHSLGWALAGFGILLALWALFYDRSRGRKRCPKCWYSMDGAVKADDGSFLCPECGRKEGSEARLGRTRRHLRMAAVAIAALLVGLAVRSYPGWSEHGSLGAVPSAILIRIANPDVSDPDFAKARNWVSSMANAAQTRLAFPGSSVPAVPKRDFPLSALLSVEAWRRFSDEDLSKRQTRAWYARYLGTLGKDPELIDGLDGGLPVRWPEGPDVPILISAFSTEWLYGAPALYLRTNADEPWELVAPRNLTGGIAQIIMHDHKQESLQKLEFEIRHNSARLYRGKLAPDLQPKGTVATFLDRIEGPAVNQAVEAALKPRLVLIAEGELAVVFNDRNRGSAWSGIDYAIAFNVEIIADGGVIGRGAGKIEWSDLFWKPREVCDVKWSPGGAERAIQDPATIEFVIRADPERAGQMYMHYPFTIPSASCWVGEIRVKGSLGQW